MTDPQYKFKPLHQTQSIPIHWEFHQDAYDKLAKGHQSNWSVFLRDDMVHICRVGGEEFYRFAMSKTGDGLYTTDTLEVYMPDDFYESARQHGWTEQKIEQHQVELRESAIEEIDGLLVTYFDISVA